MQPQDKGMTLGLRERFRKISMIASFALINGCVIAIIAFVVLYHETGRQQDIELRGLTRDAIKSAEQSLSDLEKTVRTLGFFYASAKNESARKVLADTVQLDSFLWATEKGVYRYENFTGDLRGTSTLPAGWPDFQELFRDTYDLGFNEIEYWERMPWFAFRARAGNAAERPVGLVTKIKMNDGGTGILLVVTTPSRMFGKGWKTPRENIVNTVIRDRDTGDAVLDSGSRTQDDEDEMFFGALPVNYVLQLGTQAWDARFMVTPTPTMKILILAPWLAFSLIFFLTGFSTFVAERKNRQDKKLADMSQTLADAQHALETKTSERDKLLHTLRKSEREYKAVINSVSDVIFEMDETGRITFLNETWKRVTDKEPQESVGRILFDLLVPGDRLKQQEMFEELVRGERPAYRSETLLDLGHGRVRAVEAAFSMLRMTEEKDIRIVGTITDIEKRRRAESAMREAEQRFRAIFENSISGIYQTSPEGRFVSANPALAEILGYESTEELMSSVVNIAEQVYANAEDRQVFMQKLMFEGRASGMETELRKKDGTKIWVMENARVVRTPKGGVQYYEGSIWDVTERRAAEEAMRQARLQAEMSSRSRMEFLANMSHELRTPLNAIIGFSEIIKGEVMGPVGTIVYKEYATDIFESGNYLLKVISEILEVSRIETGNRELNQNNFKMAKALRSCMTIMSGRVEQAGMILSIDLPETLPEILAEELAFKQIMLNLIGNAIKFNHKGGSVHVGARVIETGEMQIDVTDTGIGMTEAEIVKALQPFGKADNNFSTMKAGTGLGLTLVDSLARLHGGSFQIISKKGEGTTARVTLPAWRVLSASNVTPLKSSK